MFVIEHSVRFCKLAGSLREWGDAWSRPEVQYGLIKGMIPSLFAFSAISFPLKTICGASKRSTNVSVWPLQAINTESPRTYIYNHSGA